MKNSVKTRVLAFLLTIVMFVGYVPVSGISAYADGYELTVTVVDETKNPVSGAMVTVETISGTTNASGVATLTEVPSGNSVITVSKEGYETYSGVIDASTEQARTVTITSKAGRQLEEKQSEDEPSGKEVPPEELTDEQWKAFFTVPQNLVYNGNQQALIKVSDDIPAGTTVTYKVTSYPDGANITPEGATSQYVDTIPTGDIPCGDDEKYTVNVIAKYNDVEKVNADYTCTISQNNQRIIFYNDEASENSLENNFKKYLASPSENEGKYDDSYLINKYAVADFPSDGKDYSAHIDIEIGEDEYAEVEEDKDPLPVVYRQGMLEVEGKTKKGNVNINAENGFVTLRDDTLPGVYYIGADVNTDAENKKYTKDAKKLINFIVIHEEQSAENKLLYFDSTSYDYNNTGETLKVEAIKQHDNDNGKVTYSITREGATAKEVAAEISINSDGELTIVDLGKVFKNYKTTEDGTDGYVKYTVTATKTEGTIDYGTASTEITKFCRPVEIGEQVLYGVATATYELRIRPADFTPQEVLGSYTITGNKVKGWYAPNGTDENVLEIESKDETKYLFSKSITGEYTDSLEFKEGEGDGERSIYIWDKANNKISKEAVVIDAVTEEEEGVPVKIDETAPTATITYKSASWIDVINKVVTFGIKEVTVTITIDATDESSGIKSIKWWFNGNTNWWDEYTEYGLKYSPVPSNGNSWVKVPNNSNNGVIKECSGKNEDSYSFELGVKGNLSKWKEYEGTINAIITDTAGNTTDNFDNHFVYKEGEEDKGPTSFEDGFETVHDNKNPILTIGDYCGIVDTEDTVINKTISSDETIYINKEVNEVAVNFTITEANFVSSDCSLKVNNELKNITWCDADGKTKTPSANKDLNELYYCSFKIEGDGKYSYTLTMEDLVGHGLAYTNGDEIVAYENGTYESDTIVIDTTAPEITITADEKQFTNMPSDAKWYTNKTDAKLQYTIAVNEANFDDNPTAHIEYILDGNETPTEDTIELTYKGENKYEAFYEVSGDGDYSNFTVTCTDKLGNEGTGKYGYGEGENFKFRTLCIDTTLPVVTVNYFKIKDGTEDEWEIDDRATKNQKYYNDKTPRRAIVTIVERNLNPKYMDGFFTRENIIKALNYNGVGVDIEDSVTVSELSYTASENKYTFDVTFDAEANYAFNIDPDDNLLPDLAGNKADEKNFDYESEFTLDRTSPSATDPATTEESEGGAGTIDVEYNITDANQGTKRGESETGVKGFIKDILSEISFGYWGKEKPIIVTVTVYDDVAGVDGTKVVGTDKTKTAQYVYERAKTLTKDNKTVYVSDTNVEKLTGEITLYRVGESNEFTGTIKLPANESDNSQLDGTLKVTLTDLAGNESNYISTDEDNVRIVYDTISPTATISFAPAVNYANGNTYFAGDITGTINVTEANFFSNQINVGGRSSDVGWTSNSADSHTGTFTITGDGKHTVTVSGSDYSGNSMGTYTSGPMIIDTEIEAPEITVNDGECNGKAYKGNAEIAVSYFDTNFESITINVTRTQMGKKNVDVTSKIITGTPETSETGGSYFADDIEKIRDNDGIYTVTATMTDLAKHSSSTTVVFSVNRFGSVYEYSDYLNEIIEDGGQYIQSVEEDLKIAEINADQLKSGSTKVTITRDGKPLDNVKYTVNPTANDKVEVGESGWYEYLYTISKDNFKQDGLYKITVTSEDAAGNKPENSKYEDMSIQFYVDSTPPELTSVTGLEKKIVNAESLDIDFSVFDTFGLSKVTVYLDGEVLTETTSFDDVNNHEDGLTIDESSKTRKVRIVAEDIAGNITDTDSEDFTSSYVMNKSVTVSTNAFVRFYANKPLFYGVIGGIVFAAAAVGIAVPAVKKHKAKSKK